MSGGRSIVINGDLGSGKSTVSKALAARLGLRRISVGDVYRQLAQERGMTALQLNLHAALDERVDGYVDQLQKDIARSGERLVVDSRLAWFFFTEAFKVHLVTDPEVAARRVLGRPSNAAEAYSCLEEATERLKQRSDSERSRFITRYGVDKSRLRNYDLICDTTRSTPAQVVERIIAALDGGFTDLRVAAPPPLLFLDPARIYPTQMVSGLRELAGPDGVDGTSVDGIGRAGPAALARLTIGYADGCFFVVRGHRRLSAALRCGFDYVPAHLLAEDQEPVVGGVSAAGFFTSAVGVSTVYDWETAHATTLALPAHVRHLVAGTPTG